MGSKVSEGVGSKFPYLSPATEHYELRCIHVYAIKYGQPIIQTRILTHNTEVVELHTNSLYINKSITLVNKSYCKLQLNKHSHR